MQALLAVAQGPGSVWTGMLASLKRLYLCSLPALSDLPEPSMKSMPQWIQFIVLHILTLGRPSCVVWFRWSGLLYLSQDLSLRARGRPVMQSRPPILMKSIAKQLCGLWTDCRIGIGVLVLTSEAVEQLELECLRYRLSLLALS
eukprot:3289268-Amphidinium_carterae.1